MTKEELNDFQEDCTECAIAIKNRTKNRQSEVGHIFEIRIIEQIVDDALQM